MKLKHKKKWKYWAYNKPKKSIINISKSSYNTHNINVSFNIVVTPRINSRITFSNNYTDGMFNTIYSGTTEVISEEDKLYFILSTDNNSLTGNLKELG